LTISAYLATSTEATIASVGSPPLISRSGAGACTTACSQAYLGRCVTIALNCRNEVESFQAFFADHIHGRAAARAGFVCGLDRHMNARQMSRKRATIGAALIGASASRRLIPFVVVGFAGRDRLLDILKRQAELVRIELLGTAAKLHALQLMQKTPETIILRPRLITLRNGGVAFGERRRKPRLQLCDIGWRLIGALAHAGKESLRREARPIQPVNERGEL
jgi:hypothetical protein